MRKWFLLVLMVFPVLLSSCERGIYIKAPVVCQKTGATALFAKRMPKDSPYTSRLVKSINDFLNGRVVDLEDSAKMIAVMYIIDVTDMANAGVGKLKGIDKAQRGLKHFWSPVSYFTISLKTGAYSVAGVSRPLIPAVIDPPDNRYEWDRIEYSFWRKAALDWFKTLSDANSAIK